MSDYVSQQKQQWIPKQARKILLGDGHWFEDQHHWYAGINRNTGATPEATHGDGANFVFVDLHTDWLGRSAYEGDDSYWTW
jgi:prepilin-type processing-associated H-X9-DG protein